ncbi:hypothetical protein TSUD_338460 [Trifolium subterraneum]|uniref:Uncharacterized protein n=1 Tax=Trifolium subterraneum TaxID=3900 RepID=A0A2Z6P8N5_TRISU|nr:hypothetical protein TSUD_338460 [Trifolium subterraneum]
MEASVKPESESTTVSLDQSHDERKNSTVNGCIVYTRVKRSLNSCNGFSEDLDSKRFKENAEVPLEFENGIDCCTGSRDGELKSEQVPVTTFKRITRSAMKAKVESGEETVTVLEQQGDAVGAVDIDNGDDKMPVRNFKRITRSAMKEKVESGEDKGNVIEQHGADVANGKGDGKVSVSVRVTRSAMKVKVESGEDKDKVTELEQHGAAVASGEVDRTFKRVTRSAALKADEEIVTELEQDTSVVASEVDGALPALRNKMELKMSKKIVVNKKPKTVKELFRTGLLDGISVVYIRGITKKDGKEV